MAPWSRCPTRSAALHLDQRCQGAGLTHPSPAEPCLGLGARGTGSALASAASHESCPLWDWDFMLFVTPSSFLFAPTESNRPQREGPSAPLHRWGPQRAQNRNSEPHRHTVTSGGQHTQETPVVPPVRVLPSEHLRVRLPWKQRWNSVYGAPAGWLSGLEHRLDTPKLQVRHPPTPPLQSTPKK